MRNSFLITAMALLLLGCSAKVNAQGTAINANGAAADGSAMLDVSSTSKGTLITRMTSGQRNAILSPAEGLLIYNTTTQCYEGYNSSISQWVSFGCIGCILPGAFSASAASALAQTSFSANWTTSSGATTYYLDVATDAAFTGYVSGYNNLNAGGATTYSVTGLTCNTTYYYRVRAANSCGTSSNSNVITQTTSACSPDACNNQTTMTDSRDSRVYNIVAIGNQCWMAQNLNYGNYVPVHSSPQLAGEKFCNNLSNTNDPACAMGGLYEWAIMMNGSASCNGTGPSQVRCSPLVQGICPSGWHVPSHYEWTRLERVVGGADSTVYPYDVTTTAWLGNVGEGSNLKEAGTGNWTSPNNCTPPGSCNSSGFTAIASGNSYGGVLYNAGLYGNYWTTTEFNSTKAWYRALHQSRADLRRYYYDKPNVYGFSVRCVKN